MVMGDGMVVPLDRQRATSSSRQGDSRELQIEENGGMLLGKQSKPPKYVSVKGAPCLGRLTNALELSVIK
jgi:hypothetical protein